MAIPTMTNNSPIAGSIAWGAFTIQLNGVAYSVSAGSTNQRWVWWKYNAGAPSINAGAEVPLTLTDDDLVLFANKNGIGARVQSSNFVDGELLVDGSIFADALSTNLINSNHIVTAGLDAAVVKFGVMSGDRIGVNTLVGDRILANSIAVSKLVVTNFTNLLGDPEFKLANGDGWSSLSSIAVNGARGGLGNAGVLGPNAGTIYPVALPAFSIQTEDGASYRCRTVVSTDVALPAGVIQMRVRFMATDGSYIDYTPGSPNTAMAAGEYQELYGIVTIPDDGKTYVKFGFFYSVLPHSTQTIKIEEPSVIRAYDGKLIVDGTIQGHHIESKSITTLQLAADAITTDMLTAGDVLVTGLLQVAETVSKAVSTSGLYVGDNISLTELGGLVVRTPLGDTILPANGQAPIFTGSATFNALTTLGSLKIMGTTNEIAKGSTLRLATGTTAPKVAPAGSSYWPTKTTQNGYSPRGLARHATTSKYYIVDSLFGASAGGLTENATDFTPALGMSISLNGTDTVGGSSWNRSEILAAFGGVAIIGNNIFFLCHTTETYPASYDSKWYIYKGTWNTTTSKWDYTSRALYEPATFLGGYSTFQPAIGVRESTGQLVIAQCGANNGSTWLTTYDTSLNQVSRVGVNLATGTQWNMSKDFVACGFTSGDFGSERFYLVTEDEALVRFFTPSTMNYTSGDNFPLPTASPVGFMWDSSKGIFRSRGATQIFDHTNILYTTLAAVMTWRKYVNTSPHFAQYETDKSTAQWVTTTFPKRSALQLNATSIPDDITDANDPDSVSFYVAFNDVTGANAAFKRQTVPGVGVALMKYTTLSTGGENPPAITTRPFPSGTPARIISDDGVNPIIDIRGSGQWRLGDISGDIAGRVIGGAFVPIGGMIPYVSSTPPTGWLLCWGGTASEATYPLLVPLLIAAGASYTGTAPNRVATLPDTRDKFISGVGLGSVRTLYLSGGSDTVTMPDHTHPITQHDHGLGAGTTAAVPTGTGGGQRMTGAGSTGLSAANVQSGAVAGTNPAISNVPKWFGAVMIMRAA